MIEDEVSVQILETIKDNGVTLERTQIVLK